MAWDIDPEHQFEFACRIAGRDLSENEWRTYLGRLGEPQRPRVQRPLRAVIPPKVTLSDA